MIIQKMLSLFRLNQSFKIILISALVGLILIINRNLLAYESKSASKLKTEIAQLEQKIPASNKQKEEIKKNALDYLVSAELIAKAAADAEFKKAGVDIMSMVNLGWTVFDTSTMISGQIKKFLIAVVAQVATNAIVSYEFLSDIKLPSEDIPLPAQKSLESIVPKVIDDTEKEVEEAKKKAIVANWVFDTHGKKSFNYKHILFRNWNNYLNQEEKKLRQEFNKLKEDFNKKISEIKKLEDLLDDRKKTFAKQIEYDDLYSKMKAITEKELAEEKIKQEQQSKQLSKQLKGGVSGASSIDFSSELQEIQSAADKLKGNQISKETFYTITKGALHIANIKESAELIPPSNMPQKEKDIWYEQQKKIIADKYSTFLKQVEKIEKSLKDESLKHGKNLEKIDKEIPDVSSKLYEYSNEVKKNKPKLTYSWSSVQLPIGNYSQNYSGGSIESPEQLLKTLKNILKAIPDCRIELQKNKEYRDNANKKYNEYQKELTKQHNLSVEKLNSYIEKNFYILLYKSSIPDKKYLPEVDIPNYFVQDVNFGETLKDLDKKEAIIKKDIENVEKGIDDLNVLKGKLSVFEKGFYDKAKSSEEDISKKLVEFLSVDDNIRSDSRRYLVVNSEWRTTIKDIKEKLTKLDAGRGEYLKLVGELKANAEGLQIEAGLLRVKYFNYTPIVEKVLYYTKEFGDKVKYVDGLIEKAKREKFDPEKDTSSGLGKLFADAWLKVEEYKKIEKEGIGFFKNYETKLSSLSVDKMGNLLQSKDDVQKMNYYDQQRLPFFSNELNSAYYNLWTKLHADLYKERPVEKKDEKDIEKPKDEILEIKDVRIQNIRWNSIDVTLQLTKDELIDGYVEIKGYTGKGFGDIYKDGKLIGTTKLEINTGIIWQEIKWIEGSAALDPWIFRFIPAIGENRISIRAVNPGNIYSDPMDFPPIKLIYEPITRQSKIEEILNKLKDSFERKDVSGFMKSVSDNFYGGEDVLRDQLRRFFDATNTLRLYIVTDTFRSQKNRRFLDTHWERTLVSNTTSKQYKQSGYTTFVFDIDENKLLGMKGDSIFVVLSDEKEPLAGIEEKLQEQPKEQPKPKLPSGRVTMYDEYYTQKGFSFSQGVLVDLGSGEDFYWNTDGMPGTVPGGMVDLGSKDLESITSVPTTGYIKYPDWITAKEGYSYAVKTNDNKYGIFYIETLNYNSITFTWKYQPDGTTIFW